MNPIINLLRNTLPECDKDVDVMLGCGHFIKMPLYAATEQVRKAKSLTECPNCFKALGNH